MGTEKKVLLVSDLHDSRMGLEKLKNWVINLKPQLVVSAGDITSLNTPNQTEKYQEFLNAANWPDIKVLAIEGNNENDEAVNWIKKKKIYLEERNMYGFRWVGIGGWGEKAFLSKPLGRKAILITHIPPQKIPEKIKNAPRFHFFGHLHRPFFKKEFKDFTLVQIPPLSHGQGVLLTFPSEKIKLLN